MGLLLRALWIAGLSGTLLFSCHTMGPPFPDLPSTGPILHTGRYAFEPQVHFFSGGMVGEAFTWRDRVRPDQVFFSLRTIGIKRNGSYRIKSYEGQIFQLGEILEFRSKRCYEFGKRNSSDRLEVLDAWDCDHLLFQFAEKNKTGSDVSLLSVQSERTSKSDWFGTIELRPIPSLRAKKLRRKGAEFAGIILQEKPNGEVVLYGSEGARILEDNQLLDVEDLEGNRAGRLKVLYRPGDFIHCQWEERPENGKKILGLIAYATKGKKKPVFF